MMIIRYLSTLLVFACFQGVTNAQAVTLKLNGGLEAQVINIGRSPDHYSATISMRIANRGKSTAFLMLVGTPVAVDNMGTYYNAMKDVSGIASCRLDFVNCVGTPPSLQRGQPLQAYTQLDPGVEITINFAFTVPSSRNAGPLMSFSANLAYRLVTDALKDETLSDADKHKQIRMMSLSFPPTVVTEPK